MQDEPPLLIPELHHLLTSLGADPAEAAAYELLCDRRPSTVTELAQWWRMPEPLPAVLAGLAGRRLVIADPGTQRYSAVPLGQALQNLLLAHEEGLRQARAHGAQLANRYVRAVEDSATSIPIELVRGEEPTRQRLTQLRKAADHLIRCLDPSPGDDGLAAVLTDLPDGLEGRVIYARAAVEGRGTLSAPGPPSTAGYRARVLPTVSTGLVIFDDSCAVLPQAGSRPATTATSTAAAVLVIHPCSLLQALTESFERLWQRAIPLELPVTTPQAPRLERAAAQDQRIMALLLSGITDQAIARQLGLSYRTVQRRIAALMHSLGAQTRFQAGVQAALRSERAEDEA